MRQIVLLFLLVGFAMHSSAQTIYLKTLKGNNVAVYSRSEYYSNSTRINQEKQSVMNDYPNATIIGNPSTTYNCHNYAWNMVEGGSAYWMNSPSQYISDHYCPVKVD